ncbi:MAG: hypothetical protein M3158_07240 [Pseudomonadota bacterium]|nr:hypothetical protein [Pseudomonadota bacterium]
MDRSHPMARLFWMTSGFVFWTAQFTVIYAVTAVACARGWWRISLLGLDLVRAGIAVATLLALAATALVFWRAFARGRNADEEASARFVETVTLWVCGLSLVAIAYNGLPALILPACSV